MDNQQLLMFKGWFIDSYPECKDYLDLTYFDVEKTLSYRSVHITLILEMLQRF